MKPAFKIYEQFKPVRKDQMEEAIGRNTAFPAEKDLVS